ncbi:MAG TPA: lipase [Candidatus Saccharimonadia bacterium]|nr:lipase [Candidatus Saccharimonadia bacterium]
MQARYQLALALSSLLLAACSSSSNSPRAVESQPARNDDNSLVTGVIAARFDPTNRILPSPINLVFAGTRDLTINIPVANPANFGDPQVAINSLDGFSTVAPTTFQTSVPFNPATLAGAVRVFEVRLTGPGGAVTSIVRELSSPAEFVVAPVPSDTTGSTAAIVWTTPLKQVTSYLIVVDDDLRDARGNDATPDQTYFLTQRTSPLCVNGASTDPLLPAANACALEPLRQLTNAQEAAAAGAGIPRGDIVLSYVFTTQSITPVLQATRAANQAFPLVARVAPTGRNLSQFNPSLPPIADVYIGTIDVPYYLAAPSAAAPTAILSTFWRAAPGAYVAPFNAAGLDPTSTNLTFANPVPVRQGTQTIPFIMTVPNAASGRTKPAAGWPIVIFQHGITSDRTAALGVAGTLASQGFAVISIDLPLHGLASAHPLSIEGTPFAPLANERTFEVDFINNSTGAAGPDGVTDSSGTHFINLSSLLTSRDNLRQAVSDLFTLTRYIPTLSIDADATGDFDGSRIEFVGMSLGAMVGVPFLALEPNVNVGLLNVPGGGIAQLLNGSATFGPRIRAGLQGVGVVAGTPDFDRFLGAAQTVVDPVDPINYGFASTTDRLFGQLVVGDGTATDPPDQVVPIEVPGAPLSGGRPLMRVLGLQRISSSRQDANGIRAYVEFIMGTHSSLLVPGNTPAVTAEMQGEMASFIVSNGTAVVIQNTSVIRP